MPQPPAGLMVDLLRYPERLRLRNPHPVFSWLLPWSGQGAAQSAFRFVLAQTAEAISHDRSLIFDSGRISSDKPSFSLPTEVLLKDESEYWWGVQAWDNSGTLSPMAQPQNFKTALLDPTVIQPSLPTETVFIDPVASRRLANGNLFNDFGRAAFGTLDLEFPGDFSGSLIIHLGEKLLNDCIDRNPPGTVRYRNIPLEVKPGTKKVRLEIPLIERHKNPKALKVPDYPFGLTPFRFCEIEGLEERVAIKVRQCAVFYPFDDRAALLSTDNDLLNRVFELCRYSMKATSFCGVYVDGDRERIPYEADAYINQLGHYCADREYAMARRTVERLMFDPTWPTEWILFSVLMAHADYLYTGDLSSVKKYYRDLQAKTCRALARPDGLISTRTGLVTREFLETIHLLYHPINDIVDWPPSRRDDDAEYSTDDGERDGYKMAAVNTVVNAFHYRALKLIADLARAAGQSGDASRFDGHADRVRDSFNRLFFDAGQGVYRDGEGADHVSLHANMFALAFDLVPPERIPSVVRFIKSRGMACSVYGVQFLLEALYNAGEDAYALELMTQKSGRSWWNMLKQGATITWEAWDMCYKPNQDWNHAWGAAPANIIPRRLFGIQPLEPGFALCEIKPQTGGLKEGKIKTPTIRGAVEVEFKTDDKGYFELTAVIPANMRCRIFVPKRAIPKPALSKEGGPWSSEGEEARFFVVESGAGTHRFRVTAPS